MEDVVVGQVSEVETSIDIRDIMDYAEESIEDFHSTYEQSLPRPSRAWKMGDPVSPEISDIEPHIDFLNQEIAELLEVEERDFEELNDKTVYNEPEPNEFEVLEASMDLNTGLDIALLGSSLISAVGGLATGQSVSTHVGLMGLGAYSVRQYRILNSQFIQDFQNGDIDGVYYKIRNGGSRIGVSSKPIESDRAFSKTASELFHEFQFQEDSPTITHPYLVEGLEKAVSHYCLEAGLEEDIIIPRHRDAHRASVLVSGFAAHLDERGELSRQDMSDLGLYSREINDFSKYIDETSNHTEYDLGASAVLTAAEELGDEVYAETLNGDYSKLTNAVKSC